VTIELLGIDSSSGSSVPPHIQLSAATSLPSVLSGRLASLAASSPGAHAADTASHDINSSGSSSPMPGHVGSASILSGAPNPWLGASHRVCGSVACEFID